MRGAVFINPIIHAEVAPAFASARELDQWLSPVGLIRAPLPYAAGWLAAQAFVKHRKSGGIRSTPLPDFYIGAHAESGESNPAHARCRTIPNLLSRRHASRAGVLTNMNYAVITSLPTTTRSALRARRPRLRLGQFQA